MRLRNLTIKIISIITTAAYIVVFSTGCVHKVKLESDSVSILPKKTRSPLSITLIDNKQDIRNQLIDLASIKLEYDIKDFVFNTVKSALESNYSRVDVAKTPLNGNPLYAVVNVGSWLAGKEGVILDSNGGTGLTTHLEIHIYETATKKIIYNGKITQFTEYDVNMRFVESMAFLTIITALVATPITWPVNYSEYKRASDVMINENRKDVSAQINNSLSNSRVDNIGGSEIFLSQPSVYEQDSFRFRQVDPKLIAESKDAISVCERSLPLVVGGAEKRIKCLNDAWKDYMVSADGIVGEFKSYRLAYAKKLDAGTITIEDYDAKVKDAFSTLVWKASFLVKDNRPNEKGEIQTVSFQPIKFTGNHVAPTSMPQSLSSNNDETGTHIVDALATILGFTFRVALAAVPYVVGYNAGVANAARSMPTRVLNTRTGLWCNVSSGYVAICP